MTVQTDTERAASLNGGVMTGMALMLAGVLIAPLIDIFSKLATAHLSSTAVAFVRFVLQSSFMLPFMLWRGSWREIRLSHAGFHAIRGGVLALSMISFVTTLRHMEVADAIAIFFVEPMILTILSSIFLGETIGWRRYTACGVGILGALLIIQPSFGEVGPVALLPVVTAFCVAIFAIMTRLRAHREDPWAMQFQTGIWGGLFCALALLVLDPQGTADIANLPGNMSAIGLLFGVSLAATTSGILSVYAYRHAPASTLAPLQYFEIVSATVLGWYVFGKFPDALKWLGIAIIITSGLYILWRERKIMSQLPPTGEPTPNP